MNLPKNEFYIIERYFKHLTDLQDDVIYGIGDDAAVIAPQAGQEILVSTDTLVEGVHFLSGTNPDAIGYKSLAVNLSDMAAMAAEPKWATLSLTIPSNDESWIEKFCTGFSELAKEFSVCLIGGDLTQGPLSITVQIMGQIPKGQALMRSGANAGDLIYVSGYLGMAAYALNQIKDNAENIAEESLQRLHRPLPRIDLGLDIRDMANAAIDISDGIASDLKHILNASSVGAVIELDKIQVYEKLNYPNNEQMKWQAALCSGDDYELCFTIPETLQEKLETKIYNKNYTVTCIGKIVKGSSLQWLTEDGSEYGLPLAGYQHFNR